MAQNEDGASSSSSRPPLNRLRLSRNRNGSNDMLRLGPIGSIISLDSVYSTNTVDRSSLVTTGNGHLLGTEGGGQGFTFTPLEGSQTSFVPISEDEQGDEDVGQLHSNSVTSNSEALHGEHSTVYCETSDLERRDLDGSGTNHAELVQAESVLLASNIQEPPADGEVTEAASILRPQDVQQGELGVPVDISNIPKEQQKEGIEKLDIMSLQGADSNETDALVCPICMEPWANSGTHQICSLACGHLFGKSCIDLWLHQSGRKHSKCPHCNKRAKREDVRTLYVSHIAVVDGEVQQLAQEVGFLKAENHQLKLENAKLWEEFHLNKGNYRRTQTSSQAFGNRSSDNHPTGVGGLNVNSELTEEEVSHMGIFSIHSRQIETPRQSGGLSRGRDFDSRGRYDNKPRGSRLDFPCRDHRGDNFVLQNEAHIHGGKVFDMDADSQMVVISNKNQGCGNNFGLSKMSLLACPEVENISLPSGFGAIRDIRLSASGIGGPGKLALVASIGKKLSVVSLESNNLVLTYSVQSPPWSCAWDPCVPNMLYSGLQNGSLLMFDLRQTSSPVVALNGPTIRPIHTLQVVPYLCSIEEDAENLYPGNTGILSGSSSGIYLWNLGSSAARYETIRPHSVYSDKETVCVSLAYERTSTTAVASFRPSPLAQSEGSLSSIPGSRAREHATEQPVTGPSQVDQSTAANTNPFHGIFIRGQLSSWPRRNGSCGDECPPLSSRLHWGLVGAMVGHKSSSVMSRTAIIPKRNSAPTSKFLFACGDEGTNTVWLWDMESFEVTQTLIRHQSPVLDVKNVQISGKDFIGCLSERTFQLYQRPLTD